MDLKPFEPASIMNFINLVEYSSEGIVSKRILEKTTGNITLFSFDQGQKLSEHTAPFDAMVQVLEGESEILINRKAYILKAGDSIIMPADIPHAVIATTRFKMLLTMIKGK
jgi:quercetin dioxygenase-like cupin family protein